MKRAVFLDKDGTLLVNVPYNVDPALIVLMPGAAQGLSRLAQAGYALYVVSNQSGVAQGLFAERALEAVEARVRELLAAEGIELAGFDYCPHAVESDEGVFACDCRKPLPGLLQRAAARDGIDLNESWMVGDILTDVQAGIAAGCRTVLIEDGSGYDRETLPPHQRPEAIVGDLDEAASFILAAAGRPAALAARRVTRT